MFKGTAKVHVYIETMEKKCCQMQKHVLCEQPLTALELRPWIKLILFLANVFMHVPIKNIYIFLMDAQYISTTLISSIFTFRFPLPSSFTHLK